MNGCESENCTGVSHCTQQVLVLQVRQWRSSWLATAPVRSRDGSACKDFSNTRCCSSSQSRRAASGRHQSAARGGTARDAPK